MKTDKQIKSYVQSLDLDELSRSEACYRAALMAHTFCGLTIDGVNENICYIASNTVDEMIEARDM